MTNFLAGIRTNDFVILASDKNSFAQGAITISDGMIKIKINLISFFKFLLICRSQ